MLPVIAAGNDNRDACRVSPASAARVVTVGATNRFDEETDFSNWGQCLDLYAPGQDITSARLGGGSTVLSGTSIPAPDRPRVLCRAARPPCDTAHMKHHHV
ncbi:S8 family serine peptidase [Streptomyces sp. NPDC059982]|uniref:S8 family serine peptidase n=1 Tax=unclassified Streptomyces TaxID=2593676 RepID=UPI0036A6ECAA